MIIVIRSNNCEKLQSELEIEKDRSKKKTKKQKNIMKSTLHRHCGIPQFLSSHPQKFYPRDN